MKNINNFERSCGTLMRARFLRLVPAADFEDILEQQEDGRVGRKQVGWWWERRVASVRM